jgi:glutathione S-transferase
MYQLYYSPGTASMVPHLLLQEMAVDFELVFVDLENNAQKTNEYLTLNPTGRVPTLVDGDVTIYESPAICMYLCEKNPESKLMPDLGHPNRALFYQWLTYLNNTIQAELMIYFYPDRHTTDESSIPNIVAAQESRITDMFELLNKELGNKSFLVGDNITACDFFLFMLATWAEAFAHPPLSFPNLGRYLRNLVQRKSVQDVCKKEELGLLPYQ